METDPQKRVFEAPQPAELTGDEQAIQLGIEAARAEDREVDDAVARCIAAQLHGGQTSALYSFVSTGSLEHERADRHANDSRNVVSGRERLASRTRLRVDHAL